MKLLFGEERELYKKSLLISDVNLLLTNVIKNGMEVDIKTRYSSKISKGNIFQNEDKIKIIFHEPQKSITPGQSAVLYIDDIVLGGGKICSFSVTD